jgi:hypothetical protein
VVACDRFFLCEPETPEVHVFTEHVLTCVLPLDVVRYNIIPSPVCSPYALARSRKNNPRSTLLGWLCRIQGNAGTKGHEQVRYHR